MVRDADGKEWVGFADEGSVEVTEEDEIVSRDGVEGRVVVEVEKIEGDKATVILPQRRLIAGERMTVSAEDLRMEPMA